MPWRLTLLALLLAASCKSAPVAPAEWHQESGYRWRTLAAPGTNRAGFTSLPAGTTGVDFQNTVSDSSSRLNRILVQGAGLALGDVDGDGLVDIFLARTEGKNALFRNKGGMRFEDIAQAAGVAGGDRASTGAILADIDGDTDLDLVLNALGGPNALYRNDGKGHFTEDTLYPGRKSKLGSTTSAMADIDGDGDLDLYTANYKAYTTLDRLTPQERAFDQIVRQIGPNQFEVGERYRQDYKVILRDDIRAVSMVQRADSDFLFLNDGAGNFIPQPMSQTPRWRDEDGKPLAESPEEFSLVAHFYDVDGDGDPDLYVANDFEDPDRFWINDGQGNFRLIDRLAVRATSNSGMAVDFGDVNRDGKPDLFEVDMLSDDSRRAKSQIPTHTALPKQAGVFDDRPQMQRNTLFVNRGDGTFAQVAELAGVDASGWSWGAMFLDVDLDGFEDLLVAAGHPWDVMDADTEQKLKNRLSTVEWRSERDIYPKLALPNKAFRNRGDLSFEDASATWRFDVGPGVSHGMAAADLDGDGDLDVVVNRLGSPALVMRNDATAPRVAVRLSGKAPNTQGIGAEISVSAGALPKQSRQVTAGGLYLSDSDAMLTFATGAADSIRIDVRWQSGRTSSIPDARANREYQITEPDTPPVPRTPAPGSPTLFADQSQSLGHTHAESVFDETARQPLLPNAFAQMGPGVTWADLDGDGDDDLLIGTGKGGSLSWYRNDRGRFVAVPLGGPFVGDVTTILPVPTRAGTTVLVGQSSYEARSPLEANSTASVVGYPLSPNGKTAGPPALLIPGDTASIGPLALADYDGDGDLDLFVGGRIIPGAYPISASSRMFTNDGAGGFTLDRDNTALFHPVGMVSSAMFADVDGDGDPDLVLAIEWGPLKLFLNDRGKFSLAKDTGFDRRFSRWMGITTADFDEDGRLDIVATSWGRNVRPAVDSGHPLLLYAGNFNDDGILDLLLARQDDRIKAVAPLTTYARLTRALPDVAQRVRSFTAYGDATIDQVLGPAAKTAFTLGATSLEHVIWFNRGGGKFEAVPLPVEAQEAPASSPVVADFDGDGHDDLALSQNFFPTELNTPRYDAGRALLLRGDGTGKLTAVAGQLSGLMVYGDQRGAATADYDGDGRSDLVVTQNGAATRLFHNVGAKPGLRVRLAGGPANPHGIGAQIRLRAANRSGPVHEVQAGAGFWSQSSPVLVLGRPAPDGLTVEVRWPGGAKTETPVPPGAVELIVKK